MQPICIRCSPHATWALGSAHVACWLHNSSVCGCLTATAAMQSMPRGSQHSRKLPCTASWRHTHTTAYCIIVVCSLPEEAHEAPALLLGSEQYELYTHANLDDFFTRLYRSAIYSAMMMHLHAHLGPARKASWLRTQASLRQAGSGSAWHQLQVSMRNLCCRRPAWLSADSGVWFVHMHA